MRISCLVTMVMQAIMEGARRASVLIFMEGSLSEQCDQSERCRCKGEIGGDKCVVSSSKIWPRPKGPKRVNFFI